MNCFFRALLLLSLLAIMRPDCSAQEPVNIDCLETFFNAYKGAGARDNPLDMVELANGNLLVTGVSFQDPASVIQRMVFLTIINKSGTVVSSINSHYAGEGGVLKMVKMKDDGVLTVSNAGTGADYSTAFSRYDAQLNLLWEKVFQPGSILNVTTDDAGNIYFASLIGQIFLDQRLVYTKLAPDGQLLYRYMVAYNRPSLVYGNYASMSLYNGMLYLAVECAENLAYHTMMICINPSNGAIQWSRVLSSPDLGELDGFDQLLVVNNRLFAKCSLIRTANTGTLLIEFNGNGDVLNTKRLAASQLQYSMRFGSTPDGFLVGSGSGYDNNTVPSSDLSAFVRLNTSLNIINSRRRVPPAPHGNAGIFGSSDGYIYEAGRIMDLTSTTDFYIRKMAPDGQVGKCPEDSLVLNISSPQVTYYNLPLTRSTEPIVTKLISRTNLNSRVDSITQFCGWKNPCDTFFLTGGNTVCDTNAIIIKAFRSPGCTAGTEWLIDAQTIRILSQTDTSLEVQVLKSGMSIIKARQLDGCKERIDSVTLNIHIVPSKIDLGPDGSLCGVSSVTLHAQPNYASYTWEDGSIDSIHTVSQPGTYHVTTKSFCGVTYTDTIVFQPGITGKIDLGPDRVKCNEDTVRLAAPAGYSSYSWTNSLNNDTIRSAITIVNPKTNGTWFLMASTQSNCSAFDSIYISVLYSPAVDLGKDTSFCLRDSLLLSTADNYQSYLWSTGAINSTISVKQPGAYSLAATAANGCITRDTITIGPTYPLPVVSLDKDPGICAGGSRLLSATQGFSSYIWNDGSSNSSLTVSDPGTYWVMVKDFRGCNNSDTTVINIIRPLPEKFLPSDTAICPYQDLQVIAQRAFNSYSWNTGESTRDILVTHPGNYVLVVQDRFGCTGKDTIHIVEKDCAKGIFFPTAFSPNHDGINDGYRPRVNGELVSYRLQIWNRFGQIIFISTDYRQAWDGKVEGKAQDNGAYVWTATWQFSGNAAESKKGVLILTR